MQPELPHGRVARDQAEPGCGIRSGGCDKRRVGPDRRARFIASPTPGVAKPEGGQQVKGVGIGAAVGDAETDQDVVRGLLGILHLDVAEAIAREDAGVEQFVFRSVAAPAAVLRDQLLIGKAAMGVAVQPLHVAMAGGAVAVEVDLLDVLPVVALGATQTEEPFLEEGVQAIPEGEGETEALVVVAEAQQAVLPQR